MSFTRNIEGLDLTNAEWVAPCGLIWFAIAPANDTSEYDITYPSGAKNTAVKVPYSTPEVAPLRSKEANPITVTARGTVHISYLL